MSVTPTAADDPVPLVDAMPSYASFEQLYAETRDALYAYVMGLLRDRDSAEEVAAQAWERAYRHRSMIDRARGDARAWLFGIARNAALDELRRLRRHAVPFDPAAVARLAGDDDRGDVDGRIALRQALGALSTRDRELVALKFWAGLTNREIAVVLTQSESNVGTRLARIMQGLRGAL
jgi:RNA polymerase sigma-70 factor (ECF subfamily)